jgi:DNA-binding MarR family transcriptional regulator
VTSATALRLGRLNDAVPYHLHLAQTAAFASFAEEAGYGHLRAGWYTVLRVIAENPGLRATDVSRLVGRDKSTLTSVLRELERERLVERRHVPGDRRARTLRLTAAGAARLAELTRAARTHERRIDAILGQAGKTALIRLLKRLASGLGTRFARDRKTPGASRRPRG